MQANERETVDLLRQLQEKRARVGIFAFTKPQTIRFSGAGFVVRVAEDLAISEPTSHFSLTIPLNGVLSEFLDVRAITRLAAASQEFFSGLDPDLQALAIGLPPVNGKQQFFFIYEIAG